MEKRLLLLLMLASVGCTRSATLTSMRIQAPAGRKATMPTGFKICYAVNVTASDIASTTRTCGASFGLTAGFVESGGLLTLQVPKGVKRNVDLYAFLTPDTSAFCPTLTTSCQAITNCNMFKVASQSDVDTSNDVTTVELTTNFPGLAQNAVVTEAPGSQLCSTTHTSALTSSGDIVDANYAIQSSAANLTTFTFYRRANATTWSTISRSGAASDGSSFLIRPQIHAVATKPGTNLRYGMLADGTIVAINDSGDYTDLPAGSCPFSTCTLPPWMRSFSLGIGPEVYGLDRGGGLWRADSASTITSVATLPPFVLQVGF